MPTYTYACSACAHRFDAVQSIHDDALTVCPECEGTLRRVIGAVGVTFKGSGFYRTDSRGTGKSAAAKSSGSISSSTTASTSGGSSTPPAASASA